MYSFPIAVVINYCKVSSLKQHTFFFFFKSYSFHGQNHDIGLTSMNQRTVVSKLESQGNEFFSTASKKENSPTNVDFMLVRPMS